MNKNPVKKIILLIVSFALFILSCSKENETNDIELNEIEFTTQEEINTFNNKTLNKIGFLKISGSDISDLSALNSLTLISKLEIDNNPKLISLHGLENLFAVSESLSITNNRSLGDFEAIKNLNIDNLIDVNSLSNKRYVSKNPNNSFKIENNLFNPNKDSLKTTYKLKEKIYSGNLIINCNQYLKNFIKEKYTIIDGDLTIRDDNCTSNNGLEPITTLIGLESISKVNGTLKITSSPSISNLEGLENLIETDATTIISKNESLISLDGIENHTSLNKLVIYNNESLKDLKGISNISSISGSIYIWNNKSLTHIPDLVNLHSIGTSENFDPSSLSPNIIPIVSFSRGIYIMNNANLSNIEGFSTMSKIQGNLIIINNPLLENLSGLDNVFNIEGGIVIDSNNSIIDLTGLNNIRTTKTIKIENNKMLKSLKGLENIYYNPVTISQYPTKDLIINKNESLESLTDLNMLAIQNLQITNNTKLTTIKGIGLLKRASSLKIENNGSLTSLLGLENLLRVNNYFYIRDNENLIDFCSINENLKLISDGLYRVTGNAYNPSIYAMISTNRCKQP